MSELTPRQAEVLGFIRECIQAIFYGVIQVTGAAVRKITARYTDVRHEQNVTGKQGIPYMVGAAGWCMARCV